MNCPNCGIGTNAFGDSLCGSRGTPTAVCREIARLKAELSEQKSEVRRLQGMLMAWPPKHVPTLTREDVKQREASRRRTLDIVMRDAAVRGEEEG